MKKYNCFLKPMMYCFIPFICGLLILTIFNYFSIINYKIFYNLGFILTVFSFALGGYKAANTIRGKGIINGLTMGGINVSILMLLSIITLSFRFKSLLYYLVLIVSSTLGGIIEANLKHRK